MNHILQACLLGIVQGFTEFLPVSSSAHLILLPKIMQWTDFGLSFDIVIHAGSLVAIIFYFYQDKHKYPLLNIKNLVLLTIATIPVGLSGLIFKKIIATNLRSMSVIITTTILFGLLLGISYYYNKKHVAKYITSLNKFSLKNAILIGCAQTLAIIPGVSRSGITITAGYLLGHSGEIAARISFFLAIPVIFLAGLLQTIEIFSNIAITVQPTVILITGFLSSTVSSFLFVLLFIKFINKIGMWPFVIYRILLGSLLLLSSS